MNDFDRHQLETARALGYGDDVAELNRQHDPLHVAMCKWLGVTSHSMRVAAGEELTSDEQRLAEQEEAAVIALQRFLRSCRVEVPNG